jgi:hypothetical protein
VDAVHNGECDGGPVQLITSVPVLENWTSILIRRFDYHRDSADETALLLQDYALDGPLAIPTSIMGGSGLFPFASEAEEFAAAPVPSDLFASTKHQGY